MFKFQSLIVTGAPGSGKTAWASALATAALKGGWVVAGNFPYTPAEGVKVVDLRTEDPLTGEARKPDMTIAEVNELDGPAFIVFSSREQIIGLTDALVLYDEAQHDAGARDWELLSKRARLWMSMYRHYRLVVVMFTQHLKFLEVYWRRLAQGVVSIEPHLGGRLLLAVPYWSFDPETGECGQSNIFQASALWRPKNSPDVSFGWPGLLDGLRLSREAFDRYKTHQPRDQAKKPRAKKTWSWKARTPPASGTNGAAVK